MEEGLKTAIILGATGLTGGILLQYLLEDNRYGTVKVFSRSSVDFQHPKLVEYLGDLLDMKAFRETFKAQEVYCCIGTTESKTPSKELYKEIDYGIPVSAAELCKENGIDTYIVMSALGANPDSSIFYNRVKGEMEMAVLKMNIPKTHILQPSLIGGKRGEKRPGEWFFKQLMKVANFFLVGPLRKYQSIHPQAIAQCMVWLANHDHDEHRIASHEIKTLAGEGK